MGDVVAIIHTSNQKSEMTGPPRTIWTGSRFQLYLAHADIFCDRVYVLSDKLGLISPDDEVVPYDDNVKYMSMTDQLRWWGRTKQAIQKLCEAQPKIVVLYMGNFERERFLRTFARAGVRNVIYPFGPDVGISERLERIYDMDPPFEEARLEAGEYLLPEEYAEPKKYGRKPRDHSEEGVKFVAPPEDQIDWVDDDDEVPEAE